MPYLTHYIILLCDRTQGNRILIPEDGEDSSGNIIMCILWCEYEESKINLVQTASYNSSIRIDIKKLLLFHANDRFRSYLKSAIPIGRSETSGKKTVIVKANIGKHDSELQYSSLLPISAQSRFR